jgi:pimeloyl-ACP methyl ester carboxylesterase
MARKLAMSALRIAVIPAVAYATLCAFMWAKQDELLFIPDRNVVAKPDKVGLAYEDVMIAAGDGMKINAWYVPKEGAAATVLHCHGNGGNISYMGNALSNFHERGFATLAFDYRGYGQSEGDRANGDLSEGAVYRDADAAWTWLTTEKGVDPRSVVLWGQSMGGGVCSYLADQHPDAKALVLESSFTSLPDVGATIYWFLPVRLLSSFSFDTHARLQRLDMPVLIAHAPDDDVVPYALSQRNFDAARSSRKRFIELQGGHVGGFDVTPGAMDEAARFLLEE